MAIWHTYVGTFTPEFQHQIDYIETSRRALKSLVKTEGKDLRQVDEVAAFSQGIERYVFDDADGTLRHVDVTGDLANPQYLALHPKLPVLYSIEWTRTGRLCAFAIGPDGALTRLSRVETLGELADAVAIHPNGRVAYVAHFGNGTLTALPLGDDGSILGAEPFVEGNARGFFEREHFHDVRITPRGHALMVTDIGADQLMRFDVGTDGAVAPGSARTIGFPKHCHPRNLHFHPSGRHAYVGGQWDSMLYVLSAEEGVPRRIVAAYTTMPPDFQGENAKIAQLEVHPDGRTIYVCNRNSNSIAIFSVQESGMLEPIGHQQTAGRGPSSVAVHPGGRHLLVGNVFSGSIEIFGIEGDGRLKPLGAPVEARSPRAFAFVRA